MAKITTHQKKELAEMHYRAGMTMAKQLALKVGVTEKTMGKWIKEGEWEKLRMNIPLVKQEQLQKMLRELEQINQSIEEKPPGQQFADSKTADVRRKLIADLRDLEGETSVSDKVSVAMAFTKWLGKVDVAKAQEVGTLMDVFIKESLR